MLDECKNPNEPPEHFSPRLHQNSILVGMADVHSQKVAQDEEQLETERFVQREILEHGAVSCLGLTYEDEDQMFDRHHSGHVVK